MVAKARALYEELRQRHSRLLAAEDQRLGEERGQLAAHCQLRRAPTEDALGRGLGQAPPVGHGTDNLLRSATHLLAVAPKFHGPPNDVRHRRFVLQFEKAADDRCNVREERIGRE